MSSMIARSAPVGIGERVWPAAVWVREPDVLFDCQIIREFSHTRSLIAISGSQVSHVLA